MNQTLVLPSTLYARLEASAHQRGLQSIQRLLELWQANEEETLRRQQAVQQIHQVRERLYQTYGEMSDSVELLQDDRAR
jgi:hypothetical protein